MAQRKKTLPDKVDGYIGATVSLCGSFKPLMNHTVPRNNIIMWRSSCLLLQDLV